MLNEVDKKALGGCAGVFSGGVAGGKAGAVIGTAFPPIAPLTTLAGVALGMFWGAVAGSRNPAGGAVSALGVAAGVPLPPGGSGSA